VISQEKIDFNIYKEGGLVGRSTASLAVGGSDDGLRPMEMFASSLALCTSIDTLHILNKQRIYKAIETAVEVYNNRNKKIKTSKLNEIMLPIIENYPPPAYKGKFVKIKYIMQLPTPQPQFAFFCNLPQYVKDSYKRFLENKLRENFDFKGVPIQIFMRKK